MSDPRILTCDIETSTMLAHIWQPGQQYVNINQTERDWIILCWAAKWLGSDEVLSDSVQRQRGGMGVFECGDEGIIENLVPLLEQADMVVGQNLDKFDLRKIRARMMVHGMEPLADVPTFDTLTEMRRIAKHSSHKLDWMGKTLLGDQKRKTDYDLWLDCERGGSKAWATMVEYCIHDVLLTEDYYLYLRPWAARHPNLALVSPTGMPECGRCGSTNLSRHGTYKTNVSVFQRYLCKACGNRRIRGRTNLLDIGQKKGLLTNAG